MTALRFCIVTALLIPALPTYGAWSWTTLAFPGARQTAPEGVSGGRVAGWYVDASNRTRGFIYDGTTWSTVEYPGTGGYGTYLTGIHESNVVGYYGNGSNNIGFVYDGTSFTVLDNPLGSNTSPRGMSGDRIVGTSSNGGFIYDGSVYSPFNYPGAYVTSPRDLEGALIVGNYYDSSYNMHAFLHDGNNWTTLQHPDAYPMNSTYAHGVSGNKVVGTFYNSTGYHGYIYSPAGWALLDNPNGHNTVPRDINGDQVVGNFRDSQGVNQGFMVTIPEPSMLSLFVLNSLTLTLRRRST